jgi:hypothetical protein
MFKKAATPKPSVAAFLRIGGNHYPLDWYTNIRHSDFTH